MKSTVLAKAFILTLLLSTSVTAATFTVNFASLGFGSHAAPIIVNDFLTISSADTFTVDSTDLFGNLTPSITGFGDAPILFSFDTSKVNISSVSLGGISNNVPVTINAFAIDSVTLFTSSSWSELSVINGLTHLSGVSVELLESSINRFEFEYESVSAIPVPAAAWLFTSGLLGLIGVSRRKGNS